MQNLKNRDEAVVVFSGGQDSTTCLLWHLRSIKKYTQYHLTMDKSM